MPLACFSKQLGPAERKYSTFDKELLGLYLGIQHVRYFLEGRVFTAYTDHKPLTFSIAKLSDPWSSRQQRHLAYISKFTANIRHVQGKNNQVVDILFRAALESILEGICFEAITASQTTDPCWASSWRTSFSGARAIPSCATPPLVNPCLWCQKNGEEEPLMSSMAYLTLLYAPQEGS